MKTKTLKSKNQKSRQTQNFNFFYRVLIYLHYHHLPKIFLSINEGRKISKTGLAHQEYKIK